MLSVLILAQISKIRNNKALQIKHTTVCFTWENPHVQKVLRMAGFGGSLVSNILQKASILDEKVIDESISVSCTNSELKPAINILI